MESTYLDVRAMLIIKPVIHRSTARGVDFIRLQTEKPDLRIVVDFVNLERAEE